MRAMDPTNPLPAAVDYPLDVEEMARLALTMLHVTFGSVVLSFFALIAALIIHRIRC